MTEAYERILATLERFKLAKMRIAMMEKEAADPNCHTHLSAETRQFILAELEDMRLKIKESNKSLMEKLCKE